MKKSRGWTKFEVVIVLAITSIMALAVMTVVLPVVLGSKRHGTNKNAVVNGMIESRCVEGYKFAIGPKGATQQILDSAGHGIPCDN